MDIHIENLTLVDLIIIISIFIATLIFARLSRSIIRKYATRKNFENLPVRRAFIRSIANSISMFYISLFFIIGIEFFEIPEEYIDYISLMTSCLIILTSGLWAFYLVNVPKAWFESSASKKNNSTIRMLSPILSRALQVIVVLIVFATLYQTVSEESLTPFIASLGILGAAIALSAQDTFKNFFGSFVMAMDKPFEIGDRVRVDGFEGIIESMGLRSTRIRTMDDHLLSFPNGDLANKTVQNISKRRNIRREFSLLLTYDTSPAKIKEAIEIVNGILKNHEGYRAKYPPRVFFKSFENDHFDVKVIYWYHPADYWKYVSFSERVNNEILEKFDQAGIEMALPTQTIILNNSN